MTYTFPCLEEWSLCTPKITQLSWWKSARSLRCLSYDLGIDLGTSNTLIYSSHQGIILHESSVIAFNSTTQVPITIGTEARQLLGRTSKNVKVYRPVRNGVVADLKLTQLMLQYFILKAQKGTRVFRPRLVIGCSSRATDIEREALIEAGLKAGAREVVLMDASIAAAIEAGLPIELPSGNLIIDIGGGTSEMAIVCSSEAVLSHSIPVAGDTFNQAIVDYFRRTYHIHIGELTAESIKIQYGSASVNSERDHSLIEVIGLNLCSGVPQRISVNCKELRHALFTPLRKIATAVISFLEKISPELLSDISERGMMLTGGGVLLPGMDDFIREQTGLPVHIAQDPLTSVALGTGGMLQGHQNVYVAA